MLTDKEREYLRKWSQTPKRKEYMKRYRQTDKWKAYQHEHYLKRKAKRAASSQDGQANTL